MTPGRLFRSTLAVVGVALAIAWPETGRALDDQRVFRGGVDLIQVDAYPVRDGKTVEGLTAADFQLFEDGRPQQIQQVEFVRADFNATVAERRDPVTQEEGNAAAADGRNRAFVVYFDTYHVTLDGSSRARGPIVGFLDRMLGPTDVFAVASPKLRPRDLVFVRSTTTLEQEVNKVWIWGDQPSGMQAYSLEPDEMTLAQCYNWLGHDKYLEETVERRREDIVLRNLEELVRYVGGIREARKSLVILTRGWRLFRPDDAARREILKDQYGSLPRFGVSTGGSLSSQPAPGTTREAWCAGEIIRLYNLEDEERLRQIIELANRNNVTFYPVNPTGIEPPNIMTDPTASMQALREESSSLKTLAENTGGIWGLRNDLAKNFRAIADDVASYYLISYYSSNSNLDGKYRRIDVKVRNPGVNVRARPGYFAASTSKAAPAPAAAASPATAAVSPALARLARLDNPPGLYVDPVLTAGVLSLVVEIPSARADSDAWSTGADVVANVSDAGGAVRAPATVRLAPGTRGTKIDIPVADSKGPWRVGVKATSKNEAVDEVVTVADSAPGAEPTVYRALLPARAPYVPAAEPQFRRTERLRTEWTFADAPTDRSARLLDRLGQALPLTPTVSDRQADGRTILAVDLTMTPLSPGDYVIQLNATIDGQPVTRFLAFRVVR